MRAKAAQSGFSLIELLIAMVATVIVTGAIVGLLTGGQGAFRREPEVTDMQQNLRMAMDLIMRDVTAAGTGIPATMVTPNGPVNGAFFQVFTEGLDNGGACPSACTTGNYPCPCPRPYRPVNSGNPGYGERTDDLELFLSSSNCGAEPVCGYQGSASNIRLVSNRTCVAQDSTPMIFMTDGTWTMREIDRTFDNRGGPGNCTAGDDHVDLGFRPNYGHTGINVSPANLCNPEGLGTVNGGNCRPAFILAADLITYRINVGPDGVPNLERRSTGSLNGTFGSDFQVVARGIEDLQVQYSTAGDVTAALGVYRAGPWVNGAPHIISGDYRSVTTQVRVTLTARTNQGNLQGQSEVVAPNAATGVRAVRSSLTSTAAVRAALEAVSQENVAVASPAPTPQWN